MTGSRPPLRWRILAVFMMVSVLPYETIGLWGVESAYDATRYVMDSIALVGLVGYAFGRRIGTRPFWRMFAPLFIVFSVADILIGLIPFAGVAPLPFGVLGVFATVLLLGIAMTAVMSLALLRYGGWRGSEASATVA